MPNLNARRTTVLAASPIFATAVTNETRTKDYRRAKIAEVDEQGHYADLHSLRVTLGTELARAGVLPQVAQKILRHSRYSTTLKSYTRLSLADAAQGIAALPTVGGSESNPHQYPHQSGDEIALSSAS